MVYSHFLNRLWLEMEKAQVEGISRASEEAVRRGSSPFNFSAAPMPLQNLAVEAFFSLIRNGYIVENCSLSDPNYVRFENYRWTERGQRWIDGTEPIPEYAAGYLHFVRSRVPSLDPVIEQYLGEAAAAFERHVRFAAAVMLGAASEKALYLLGDSLLIAMVDSARIKRLQGILGERKLQKLSLFIRDAVQKAREARTLPYEIHEGVDAHLASICDAVRVQRNDAVHPVVGASVSETSVRFMLVAFPYTLEKTEALRTWFVSHPQSI